MLLYNEQELVKTAFNTMQYYIEKLSNTGRRGTRKWEGRVKVKSNFNANNMADIDI